MSQPILIHTTIMYINNVLKKHNDVIKIVNLV